MNNSTSPLPVSEKECQRLGKGRLSVPTLLVIGILFFAASSFGQIQATNPPSSTLKKLSLEELMDLDVTSVARQPSLTDKLRPQFRSSPG